MKFTKSIFSFLYLFLKVSKMLMYKTGLRTNIHNLCSCRRKAARLPNGRKRDDYLTLRLPKGEKREHAWKQERLICHCTHKILFLILNLIHCIIFGISLLYLLYLTSNT